MLQGLILMTASIVAAPPRPMTVEDMFKFARVSDPQVSPDGKLVAYVVANVLLEENKSVSSLWIASLDGKSPPRRLTNAGKKDSHPRWSPDGSKILFQSNRSGTSQLWVIEVGGGEARQLTTLATGAENGLWSPDGSRIAFVSGVHPEFSSMPFSESDAKNKAKLDAAEKNPVKARVFKRLFFRHWDSFVEDKRQHLFVMPAAGGEPKDVTPGDRDAFPTSTTFSSGEDFTFSPDGSHLVFTAVPASGEAWTTNYDICRVPVTGGTTEWECLTSGNSAADGSPRYSPNGKRLAYRAQKKAGYEADKWDLLVTACEPDGRFAGPGKNLTSGQDVSAGEFIWRGDADLLFTYDSDGSGRVQGVNAETGATTVKLAPSGTMSSLSASRDGAAIAVSLARMDAPPEVYAGAADASPEALKPIAKANDELLATLDRPRPESLRVPVEGGEMQMWLLKPPGFDAGKKWPLIYLVHGGPQGAWEDSWSFRWNPQAWAAQGYVVAMPNPRGSTGFGQKFCDEISGDWGGKCYRDLMAGVDKLEKLPFVDASRIASAGGSFGGYMQNWFAVNTNRFKCLVTHCSVWNFESMWGTTDELWFDEFEHGGLPWDLPKKYREYSPHVRAGELGKHKTPMLVIHNDLDFRCPIGQGHELYAALQRQGVPSRFVNFPDEGHWVLKPANSRFWHQEIFAFLKEHCPPGVK
jgi:dipeptidyl aminopeptidase/acylaminoacyl peptidase